MSGTNNNERDQLNKGETDQLIPADEIKFPEGSNTQAQENLTINNLNSPAHPTHHSNINQGAHSQSNYSHNQTFLTYDGFLKNRIQFGKYQLKTMAVMGLLDFVDGIEFLFITLLVAILKKEWDLSQFQLELLISFYFLGAFLGAIYGGVIADWLGRKLSLNICIFIELIIVLYTAFIQNINQMLAIRLVYGFVIGATLPIGILIIAEQTPNQYRGRTYTILHIMFVLGKLYLLLIASFFLVSLSEGNWRAIAICNVIPCFILFISTVFFIDQSARYLYINNKEEDALVIMNKMIEYNTGKQYALEHKITPDQISRLKYWKQSVFEEEYLKWDRFFMLFNQKNLPVTWRLGVMAVLNSIIGAGTLFLLPFLFDAENQGLKEYFYTTLVELPAIVLVYFLIDWEKLGRIHFYNITCFIGLILYYLIYHYRESVLVLGIAGIKFIARMKGGIFTPIIAESYSTIERALGIALCSAIGRIVAAISPFILFPLYLIDKYLPFLLYAICSLFVLFCTLTYPVDKTGKDMEPEEKKSDQVQKNDDQFSQESDQLKAEIKAEDVQGINQINEDNQEIIVESGEKQPLINQENK